MQNDPEGKDPCYTSGMPYGKCTAIRAAAKMAAEQGTLGDSQDQRKEGDLPKDLCKPYGSWRHGRLGSSSRHPFPTSRASLTVGCGLRLLLILRIMQPVPSCPWLGLHGLLRCMAFEAVYSSTHNEDGYKSRLCAVSTYHFRFSVAACRL